MPEAPESNQSSPTAPIAAQTEPQNNIPDGVGLNRLNRQWHAWGSAKFMRHGYTGWDWSRDSDEAAQAAEFVAKAHEFGMTAEELFCRMFDEAEAEEREYRAGRWVEDPEVAQKRLRIAERVRRMNQAKVDKVQKRNSVENAGT